MRVKAFKKRISRDSSAGRARASYARGRWIIPTSRNQTSGSDAPVSKGHCRDNRPQKWSGAGTRNRWAQPWKVGRVVMHRLAKLPFSNGRTGSIPVPSAKYTRNDAGEAHRHTLET